MTLWLALCLPALPLQLAERALVQAGPLAIVDGPQQRPVVVYCNAAAAAAGIGCGQKLAAAQALARDLMALQRSPARERAALHELACWAYQFSAQIVSFSAAAASGLLLETGASRRLYAGHDALHRRIARGLRGLGYQAAFGYASTPRAAQLIGLARTQAVATRDVFEPADLQSALAPLPLALLDWDAATLATLQALGFNRIGDLLALPRDAFGRRFGARPLQDLDRALGRQPDPQTPFFPPDRFDASLELPADLTETAQLQWPAQRLLGALEGFLRGRNAGVTELLFSAHHSARHALRAAATRIALKLASPERAAARLARLLAEQLTRVQLPQPAVALQLTVERLLPFAPAPASLLPPAPGAPHGTDWLQLAETLHARLGSERVFQLHTVDDHRPEYAFRVAPVAVAVDGGAAATLNRVPAAAEQRPLLLLPAPQALDCATDTPRYGGALTLLVGPERIESGWWDLGDACRCTVHRDYFVARNPRGQMLWVYRELAAPRGWFLHGFFS